MKLNWGNGIIVVYAVFLIVVLGTVAFTTTVDVDLVANDYYEQELKYQNEINKKARTNELSEQVEINLDSENLKMSYPASMAAGISGKINFYRPSDKKLDFDLGIQYDSSFIQYINKEKLAKGLWKIKVDWKFSGIDYINEKIIVIN